MGSAESDAQLMARAGDGDREAWRALYLRHRDAVHATARRFLGEDAEARDTVQEVFLSLFRTARSYRPTVSFGAYLRRITVNRCINVRASAWSRSRSGGAEQELWDLAADGPGPDALLEREQASAAVRQAIARLPDRQRMAVVLARFEGLSTHEIAQALECSLGSVDSLLFRARQALARMLGPR